MLIKILENKENQVLRLYIGISILAHVKLMQMRYVEYGGHARQEGHVEQAIQQNLSNHKLHQLQAP